ncbi:VCBS domain-containing protein, partial [Shewanella benthica]|nr:VCBS domain-containing protein [Shewanella benthica]
SVSEVYNGDISWSDGTLSNELSAGEIQGLIDGFTVDSNSWDYSILNSVVQFLALGETITLSFEVTVTDNDGGSDTKTVSLTITGTNDLPVLTVDMTGGVTEDATDPNLTDSGALSFTDVDVNNTHSVSEVYNGDISWSDGSLTNELTAGEIQGLIDGFTVDSDSWDYSILNSVVQFLAQGETITLSFEVTVTDNDGGSDTKTVSLTITGTNDLPVLTVDMTGGVTEDATDPNLTDSGALSFTDVDLNNTHSVSEVYNGDISWSDGTLSNALTAGEIQGLIDGFTVDSDSWDYSILNSVVQFLAQGETITLSFEVTVTDNDGGSDTKTVSLTITGTNDLPVLTVDMTGGVTEDATDPNLTDSGALSFTDVDLNNTHSVSEVYNGDISWSDGTLSNALTAGEIQGLIDGFTVDSNSWDYSILNSVVQFLAQGETITLSFEVTVTDNDGGSDTNTVSLTITGTNDDPVLTVDMTGGVTEDATDPNLTDSGALSFTDVDVNNTHSVSEVYNGDISWSGGTLTNALTAGEIQGLIDGFSVDSDSWDYSILNSVVQFLAQGETITLSFEVTVTDNDGGSDTNTVSLTITGTNDLPEIVSVTSVSVSEEGLTNGLIDNIGVPTDTTDLTIAMGSVTFTDVDAADESAFTVSLSGPLSNVSSGGELVIWTWDSGSKTLTGMVGSTLVMTIVLSSVTAGASQFSFDYSVTLYASLDHSISDVEDIIVLSFGATINDGYGDVNTNLDISIEDDSPIDEIDELATPSISHTVGQMYSDDLFAPGADGFGSVDFSVLTAGLKHNGFDLSYSMNGNTLIATADGTEIFTLSAVTSADGSIDYLFTLLEEIDTEVLIDYDLAGAPANNNGSYYVDFDGTIYTDEGQANMPITVISGTITVNNVTTESNINSNSHGIGVGPQTSIHTGEAIKFTYGDGLTQGTTLAAFSLGTNNNGNHSGSSTISYLVRYSDGSTKLVNTSISPTLTIEELAPNSLTILSIEITYISGEDFQVLALASTTSLVEFPLHIEFAYNATDGDGDAIPFTVDNDGHFTIILDPDIDPGAYNFVTGTTGVDALVGGAGADYLASSLGDDSLDGGMGSDILIGGQGSDSLDGGVDTDEDTFIWEIGSDDGSTDTVYNFDPTIDVLNLADILVGEDDNAISLDDYFDFNFVGGNTEIYVDSDGLGAGGITLTIVINGVDLTNSNNFTDIQVINNLLTDTALIIDTIP